MQVTRRSRTQKRRGATATYDRRADTPESIQGVPPPGRRSARRGKRIAEVHDHNVRPEGKHARIHTRRATAQPYVRVRQRAYATAATDNRNGSTPESIQGVPPPVVQARTAAHLCPNVRSWARRTAHGLWHARPYWVPIGSSVCTSREHDDLGDTSQPTLGTDEATTALSAPRYLYCPWRTPRALTHHIVMPSGATRHQAYKRTLAIGQLEKARGKTQISRAQTTASNPN